MAKSANQTKVGDLSVQELRDLIADVLRIDRENEITKLREQDRLYFNYMAEMERKMELINERHRQLDEKCKSLGLT